ncbi:MAG: glycoside hydrolase family 2 protein [Armatimonadota bacterium]
MDFRTSQHSIDLCGDWSFSYSGGPVDGHFACRTDLDSAGYTTYPCTVPGNFELDLQASGIIEDPFHGMNIATLTKYESSHVWYSRRFEAEELPGHDAQLVFEGLDCLAEVYLNGEHIGSADNMLIEHVFDITGRLRRENKLLVHIRPVREEAKKFPYPPSVGALCDAMEGLYVRKAPHVFGWDIMPRAISAGVWRPVKIRFVPRERLENVFLETHRVSDDHSTAQLVLHHSVKTHGEPGDVYEVEVRGTCGNSTFSATKNVGDIGGRIFITVNSPRLWWIRGKGEPNLYDVTLRLMKNGSEIDSLAFTHGIKNVELDRTSTTDAAGNGEFCIKLNGEKVFILGTNWVPADAYHSRDADLIPRILELVEDIGCNMVRCWGGNVYESDAFFDICDRKGILVWQDFAMACAYPPQDEEHCKRIEREARAVVRRLRQHACLAMWSGDNEIDYCLAAIGRNPNHNVLTREVLPKVLREEDWVTPYIPSSPYIDDEAFRANLDCLPENHPWGPRDYYKSDYYKNIFCHFASEIGYHGCPSAESVKKFISPDKLWPYKNNDEWRLHSTDPIIGVDNFGYRVELMANQIKMLFGEIPDNLEDFAFASQASQAEAMKFFIEMFRMGKWRRTGIIWWNIRDGWPQFSDAVVDYYFDKKLAYQVIKRCQQPLVLSLREPSYWRQELVACNDTTQDIEIEYSVTDIDTGEPLLQGDSKARADAVTVLGQIPASDTQRRCYLITWTGASHAGINHYLAGFPTFDLGRYRGWLAKARLI